MDNPNKNDIVAIVGLLHYYHFKRTRTTFITLAAGFVAAIVSAIFGGIGGASICVVFAIGLSFYRSTQLAGECQRLSGLSSNEQLRLLEKFPPNQAGVDALSKIVSDEFLNGGITSSAAQQMLAIRPLKKTDNHEQP